MKKFNNKVNICFKEIKKSIESNNFKRADKIIDLMLNENVRCNEWLYDEDMFILQDARAFNIEIAMGLGTV